MCCRQRLLVAETDAASVGHLRFEGAPDGAFDAVVTLSSIEHFGLGRYGDAMDLDADRAAAAEMRRVLRPGGRIALLEVATPPNRVMRWGHGVYFGKVVPVIGKRVGPEGLEKYDEDHQRKVATTHATLVASEQVLAVKLAAGTARRRRPRDRPVHRVRGPHRGR